MPLERENYQFAIHTVFTNVEQPQNSRQAGCPVLVRRSTMLPPHRGHFGRAESGCRNRLRRRRGFELVDATRGSRYIIFYSKAFAAAKTPRQLRGTTICKRFCHPSSNAKWF